MNAEIENLIFTAYHGELTDSQRDALTRWVAESPANARLLIQYANETRGIEIALRSDQAAQADSAIGSTENVFIHTDCDAVAGVIDQSLESLNSSTSLRLNRGRPGLAPGWRQRSLKAAAALLGIAALLGVAFWFGGIGTQRDRQDDTAIDTPGPSASLAENQPEIIETTPAVAADNGSELIYFTNEGGDSRNQMGDMPFGFAAYTFWKRGTVLIAGPAQWQMLKGDAIRLFDGLLVATAEQEAYEPLSFLIDQTEIRVQGAEFGVYRTGPDTAFVNVFEGSIEFSLVSAAQRSRIQTMDAGQVGVLRTHLGTVEQQASATSDDWVRFSPALDRLRYRPLEKTNSVSYRHNIPRSLYSGVYDYPQSADMACLSHESAGVVVAADELDELVLDPFGMVTLSAGQAVDSYILHFDPAVEEGQADAMIEGTITFDRPILAVLGSSDSLRATDARYGSRNTKYPRSSETTGGPEGSESWGLETADDNVQLSIDRKRLMFTFRADRDLDQVRILVEAR